ncbi:hypothetical protein M1L60_21795 [Actinoplanes sp. TRM 88003]|uniref:DNA-binding protein n=1 Tax=Paractinoplanes aksuensis TaxID=2939490 RepID=A0ABT1DQU6_9ACTN|nr:hypothetical protein [Actinoplanes aksuensis]MCO8273229.1 hypothetical protein [Actinoplanes aksuensis]
MSESLLEAGAVLPGSSTAAGFDTVTARSYEHPVLDGRTVVRLVGATVGPAEDITMEFLGFAPAAEPVPVGHALRQALGFPAWALVHDPAHGRHALALVKDMERLARVARSKPGNAKDGYDGLAGRLGEAAPQFLPTFWEQAGRAFLAADNQRMAGTCFAEARRAEQVHGLTVDEDRVRDVHLEFAFAGALTAAMLAEYARGVVGRRGAAEAYELVKTLALRRVAGGLPPHASMAPDLARLAKAAGLDAEAQADEVVTHLLTCPALVRSHPSVWKAYRKSLVRLGKRDAAVRARLLEIFPEPPGWDVDISDQWLELLEASGAAADLIAGAAPGRWLERLLASRRSSRGSDTRTEKLLSLVERMAPALAAGGPVVVAPEPWRVELDVLDVCLAHGVDARIGNPRSDGGFNVAEWARDQKPGRRDLTALAADPVLRPMLRFGVREAMGQLREGSSLTSPALPVRTLEQVFGAAGVREVLAEVVRDQTDHAGATTIAGLDSSLTELAALWSPSGMALAADGFRQLHGLDVAATLARSLRAGSPAELGWGAYEEAAGQLKNVRSGTSWPEIVVHDDQSAHVIAPGGQPVEHVFRFPPAGHRAARTHWTHTTVVAAGGDLLVSWAGENGPAAYWASRPDDVIEADFNLHHVGWHVPAFPLPAPGGGLTTGVRPLHAGDSRGPGELYPLATDGQAFWRCEWVQGDSGSYVWRWREFDPLTGDTGRVSLPAFLAELGPGEALVPEVCQLRPADFPASPLGVHEGMWGWRSATAGGRRIGVGLDGRRVTLSDATLQRVGRSTSDNLVAAIRLPGSADDLPVTQVDGYPRARVRIWTADGEHLLAEVSEGTMTMPPLAWWHALTTRDEAGSAALRKVDDQIAARLLAIDESVTGTVALKKAVTANVEAHLPEVTDGMLRSGLAEIVVRAVRLNRRLAEIPAHLETVPAPPPVSITVTDDALDKAWEGLTVSSHRSYYSGSSGARHQILEQVSLVSTLLRDGAVPGEIPAISSNWPALLAGLGAVALRAAAATTGDADREALAVFLAEVAAGPLTGDSVPLRVFGVTQPHMGVGGKVEVQQDDQGTTVLFPPGQNFVDGKWIWLRDVVQIGSFTVPADSTVGDEFRPSGRMTADRLRAFGALLAERGPAPWRPEAAEALAAATGMTRAEAILLLAGLPGIAVWEANFLTAEQRATLGLTAGHAKVAKAALGQLTGPQRLALLDAAMPVDPADLWQHGPDVAAVAAEWIRLRGRRLAVPDDLVAELARVVESRLAAAVLQAIAGPRPGDWLTTDGRSEALSYHHVRTLADDGTPFDEQHLKAVADALPWLAYRLHWDDPLRPALPEALRLVRARLANPALLVGTGMFEPGQRPEAGPALVDGASEAFWAACHIAPAKLTGSDDPALGFVDHEAASSLRILLSGWIDAVVSTPEGAAGDPRDPRVSAPELVAAVAERFELEADAAAYYLQLLALPDPTDKAVQGFNGWKVAAVRRAQQALVAAGLVVEAKRERAGRPVFLPGGWRAARAPQLPMESWKEQFYPADGRPQLVTRPLPELFATAWARIVAGDGPRYRDLEEKP